MEKSALAAALEAFSSAPANIPEPTPQVVPQEDSPGAGDNDTPGDSSGGIDVGAILKSLDPSSSVKPPTPQAPPKPADAAVTPPADAAAAAATGADAFPETIPGDEKANARWGELRKQLKEYEAKVKDYEARPATPQNDEVLKQLEAKLAEKEQQMQEIDDLFRVTQVEHTREYRQLVDEPLTAIVESVEELAARYKVNVDALTEAFAERDTAKQDEMFAELIGDFSPRDRNRLYNLADDALKVYATADRIRTNSAQSLAEITAREAAEAQLADRQRTQAIAEANQQVLGIAETQFAPLGFDFAEIRSRVEGIRIDTATPQEQAYASVAVASLPSFIDALKVKHARVVELEATVAALTKASSSGGSSPGTVPPAADKPKNMVIAALERDW